MKFSECTCILFLLSLQSCVGSGGGVEPDPVPTGPDPMRVTYEETEMRYGDPSRHDYLFAKDPTVIRLGSEYRIYYSLDPFSADKMPAGVNKEVAKWHCGVGRSTDLIHWERVSDLKLLSSSGEEIGNIAAPCVKIFDGVIHMFYQRYYDGQHAIWHATTEDGITFINTSDRPAIVPDNSWSIVKAIDAEVYRVGDKMVMMYATRDKPSGAIQMFGMYEAPYGSDYGPDKWVNVCPDGPFFRPTYGWEGKCTEAPSVLEKDGVYYLFYAGSYNSGFQQIGLATSTDGYHFTRVNYEKNRPGLFYKQGPAGSWNAGESGHPGVFEDADGKVYLFFQGKAGGTSTADPYMLSMLKLSFTEAE